MFSIRSILMGMIIFLPFNNAVGSNTPNNPQLNAAVLNAAVQVMRECYEVKHLGGTHLAQCVLEIFHHNEFYNPEKYRIFLTGDVPGNSTLIINNEAGYTITCAVSAQQKLEVSNCKGYQGSPLTNGDELSITPP